MFFNPKKKTDGFLQIEEEFATLISASENEANSSDLRNQSLRGELTFLFKFKVSQIKAIEQNAFSVVITAKSSVKDRPVIFSQNEISLVDKKTIIDNILQYRNKIDNINKKDNESFILRKVGDISSRINNHLLNAIKTNQPIEETGIKKVKIVLRKKDSAISNGTYSSRVTPVVGHSSLQDFSIDNLQIDGVKNSSFKIKKFYHKLLFSHGKPVSNITFAQDRVRSTAETTQGILKSKQIEETIGDPTTEIVNSILFPGQGTTKDEEYVTLFESRIDEFITVDSIVKFRQEQLNQQSLLLIKFDLLQTRIASDGSRKTFVLESVTKNLDIQKHISSYFYAKKAPTVSFSKTTDKIILSIQNNKSNGAAGAAIFKKTINNGVSTGFSQITKINLKTGTNRVELKNYDENTAIYRVVPISSFSGFGSDFSDVVIKGSKQLDRKLAIIPVLNSKGIKVFLYKSNPLIRSAVLLMKDVTLKQTEFLAINSVIFEEDKDSAEIIISNLTPNHIYELGASIHYENGDVFNSTNVSHIEYLPYEGNSLTVRIENFNKNAETQVSINETGVRRTSTNIPDPKFAVRAEVLQDQIGRFKVLADSLSKTFNQETINNNKSVFDKLILFEVIRYNKTTCEIENLGIIGNNDTFIDSEKSALFLAKKAAVGNEYLYVINPLLRDPSSLLEGQKQIKDVETKKSYLLDPSTKLHPLNLKKGLSITKNYLESRGKDEALYGKIGASYTIEVSYKEQPAKIENFEAVLVGIKKIYLKWFIQSGSISRFDHFIILKEIEKTRTIIGKSHAALENFTFLYEVSKTEVGVIKFILVPVYNDYSIGESIYSNKIIIEE